MVMVMGAPILLWVAVGVAIGLICLTQFCFVVIRTSDATLYEHLGKPDVLTNNNILLMWRFWRWVLFESYGRLATPRLQLVVGTLRVGAPCFLLAVVIAAIHSF